jgi:hypothetical protein
MENLSFKLEVPIFKDGVPVHVAIKAWDNLQSIIDKTCLGGNSITSHWIERT